MIRPFPLTTSQRKALDSQRNIAVTASAGSGKTATLVERYVELLCTHPDLGVPQVLAITFTQKAAAEMRDRVAARLRRAIASEPEAAARHRLVAVYEDLPAARISTIHAFCASLLREFPVEAGVDPGFSVLEEVEARTLQREAVHQSLAELAGQAADNPGREALRQLLQEWERPHLHQVLYALLRKRRPARQWSRWYLDHPPEEIFAAWQQVHRESLAPVCRTLLTPDFLTKLAELTALAPQQNPGTDSAERLLAPARDAIRQLLADPGEDTAGQVLPGLTAGLTTAAGQPYSASRLGRKDNWDPGDLTRLRQLLPGIGQLLAPHADLFAQSPGPVDQRAARLLPFLGQVFLQVDARYARRKGEGARLDFDDLQERALDLLRAPDLPVAPRLARQYRFVMVDEFQDTDPLQWDLIRPLVSTAGQLDPDKLFIVGDPKQSIYSFRDADVAIFARVKAEIRAANQRHQRHQRPFHDDDRRELPSQPAERQGDLSMAENFRTLAAPIALVNHLFPQFMQEVAGEPFQVGYEPLICQRPAAATPGSVEILLTQVRAEEEEFDSLQREAELLARRLRHLFDAPDLLVGDGDSRRPPTYGEVAILLRRRRFLPAYEQALRVWQLPFQVLGGLGFYQRQEVYDLANLLRLLHNPRDSVALLGALRSPYFGLSDDALFLLSQVPGGRLWDQLHAVGRHPDDLAPADQRAIADAIRLLDRWGQRRDRVPLVELLHGILEDTGAWGFLSFGERGDQNQANLRKILDLARAFGQAGPATLADFVAQLDLLTAEEEKEGEAVLDQGGDAIQILTVHAAKGLEFPIVLVPDLDGEFNLRLSDAALIDPEHGIGVSFLDPGQEFSRQPSYTRRLLTSTHRRRAIAEEKRLFYVAATRARDHLLLSGRLRPPLEQLPSLTAARDRLSWVCRGLELHDHDLERGEKSFTQDGRNYVIRIHTDPAQFPVPELPERQIAADLGERLAALQEQVEQATTRPSPASPASLPALHPLAEADDRPSFSATELALFAHSPEEHQRHYLLGLPLWDPTAVDPPRRRALLLGDLAHLLLEEYAFAPGQDAAAMVDDLLLTHPLPATSWQAPFRRDLLTLLERFRVSAFGRRLQTDASSRPRQSFTLRFAAGQVDGKIDCLFQGPDGQWELVDYQTTRIPSTQRETEAQRHRLRLALYALFLRQLRPNQPEYRATIYFPFPDASHTFVFAPADLSRTSAQTEDLLARLVSAYST